VRSAARALGTLVGILSLSAHACGGDPGAGGTAGAGGMGATGQGGGAAGAGGTGDTGGSGDTGGAANLGGGGGGGTGLAAGSAGGAAVAGTGGTTDAGTGAADGGTDVAPRTPLKTVAGQAAKFFGAALSATHLSEADFAATAAAELSIATPENEMKWNATEPMRGAFTFSSGDTIVAFAARNGILVKGHTLVWHSQLPAWVSAITDGADLHDAMINHITQVVSHYRGQVVGWDVVNEAIADNGQSLRSTVFSQEIGASYIDDAFAAAHAADPGARLYYNDYGAEGMNAKGNAVYSLVQGMLARGVPIHGVGLQMHTGPTDSSPTAAEVTKNMQRLADLGLEVVISEMDVQICTGDLDSQRTRFHDIVAACVAQPACKAVTVWGVPDKYSWRNGQTCQTPRPLLFDDNYVPKPAYTGVYDAFMGR
jgi:endo-1,4-beta-xylanase